MDTRSDAQLVGDVADVVSVPRFNPADSFVLHAPLELLARAELLRHVPPAGRDAARARIVGLGVAYSAAGDAVAAPQTVECESVAAAVDSLFECFADDVLDGVDRYATWLGDHATPADLQRHLGSFVVRSLAAAAHGAILLQLLSRFPNHVSLLRGPVRELARNHDWRLSWFDSPLAATERTDLLGVLLRVPLLGVPGSVFINPLMRQAEDSRFAPQLILPTLHAASNPLAAANVLARIANWSMLQEPTTHAAFGWSHCLTMPQAVMSLNVDPTVALAVAATYVVGFRAALGTRTLDVDWSPSEAGPASVAAALAAGSGPAAAWGWRHAASPGVEGELAANASAHHDAHLVKYTLACLDVARADPEYRHVHLAAAAKLAGFWATEQPADPT